MSCVCHTFVSVHCCLVGPAGTSWLSFVMLNIVFVTFPRGILRQVGYLIVSIPDLCHLFLLRIEELIFDANKMH